MSILHPSSTGQFCGNCGKVYAVQDRTPDVIAWLRFEVHRLRYYATRHKWDCKPLTQEE